MLGISDINCCYGFPSFVKACNKNSIKPILGVVKVADDSFVMVMIFYWFITISISPNLVTLKFEPISETPESFSQFRISGPYA